MKEQTAAILFTIFTVLWLGFVALNYLGSLLGDCLETNIACLAFKEYGPRLVLWRGAAIQLAATLVFVLHRKA